MSRPRKIGLDYFPVDTDIFDDFGIRILMSKFGADGPHKDRRVDELYACADEVLRAPDIERVFV